MPETPIVSVVIVNYRGAEDTIRCLRDFAEIDWPQDHLELVVVDNASGDDSVRRIREAVPYAKVIASKRNTGFAGGCNLGVRRSRGEYIAFINSDARPGKTFLSAAVPVLREHEDVGAVATKVLDWEGKAIDFVDAGMSWYGQAFKIGVGAPAPEGLEAERDVLFGTGSSLIMRKDVFEEVGGFDEDYFMFFEDVDLGWRLWLLGYRVRYVPASVSYHRHHASMSSVGSWREKYLLERNALYTIYKNYDAGNLEHFLPGAMALAIRRGVLLGGDDPSSLDLAHGNIPGELPTMEISRTAAASAYALDEFVRNIGRLSAKRRALQQSRLRPDSEILRLFGDPLRPNLVEKEFQSTYRDVVRAFDIKKAFVRKRRIAVMTADTVAKAMAGPAIRAWHIASALSQEHDVQLVTTGPCSLTNDSFRIRHVNPLQIVEVEKWADVIIFQGMIMHENPVIAASKKVIVADIYDPMHLEQLEQGRDLGKKARRNVVRDTTAVLNQQIRRADFLMCASAKQRDFWLGTMAAMGRVNPQNYDADESLDSLISIVPFGVGDTPPVHVKRMVRGVIPGINEDDKIILWGGGIYNWFDPLTLIRAIDKVKDVIPNVRLLFMGVKHPNPAVPEMRMVGEAHRLARRLGLFGTHVILNEEWVAYEDRQNFLLEADLGVSTHLDHIETTFSFRTRILDYLWASLPIVCTGGDSFGEVVENEGLGRTVPAEDVDALVAALIEVLSDDELAGQMRDNVARVANDYRWSKALEPLIEFCRDPHRAPDLVLPGNRSIDSPVHVTPPAWGGVTGDLRLVRTYLREGGPRLLGMKIYSRAKRLTPQPVKSTVRRIIPAR